MCFSIQLTTQAACQEVISTQLTTQTTTENVDSNRLMTQMACPGNDSDSTNYSSGFQKISSTRDTSEKYVLLSRLILKL